MNAFFRRLVKRLVTHTRHEPMAPPEAGPPPRCVRLGRAMAWVLDDGIRLPFINRRIGLDPLLGLIPGWGDWVSLALSVYLVIVALYLKAPWALVRRLILNLALDAAVGLVPVVGDLLDFGVKANRVNLALIEQWIHAPEAFDVSQSPIFNRRCVPFVLRWPRFGRSQHKPTGG